MLAVADGYHVSTLCQILVGTPVIIAVSSICRRDGESERDSKNYVLI